jgi:hypothetical protein
LAQQNLRHPEGVDDYPIRAHANTTLTRLVGWVNSASYYLFRESAEWPVERFPARSIPVLLSHRREFLVQNAASFV